MLKVEFLRLPSGRAPAEEFISEFEEQDLGKIFAALDILRERGALPFPHARKIKSVSGLWELRIRLTIGAVRLFYVYSGRNRVVLISGFIKKSQKTPKREIHRALTLIKSCGVFYED